MIQSSPKLSAALILLVWLLAGATAFAEELSVADPGLQSCLQKMAKKNNWSLPHQVTELTCHSKSVKTLQGLEAFTKIETLSLYNNKLTEVDIELSKLQQLHTLNLARNQIEQLRIDGLQSLHKLYLFDNGMDTLELLNLPQLQILKANNNDLKNFNYDVTPELQKMYIFNNKLETIDIYNLPTLLYMDCRQNPMPDELYDEMDKMDTITFLHDGNAEDW